MDITFYFLHKFLEYNCLANIFCIKNKQIMPLKSYLDSPAGRVGSMYGWYYYLTLVNLFQIPIISTLYHSNQFQNYIEDVE